MAALVSTLLAVGVWALIGQGASYGKLWSAVQRADVWWLILALATTVPVYFGYALVYQAASRVRGGPRPHLGVALRMTIAVFGAAVVATAAGRLGSEYWSLRRMQETRTAAWARVLALNIMLWAVLGGLAWVGALVCLVARVPHVPLAMELTWLLAAPACTLPVLFLSAPPRRHLTEPGGGRIRSLVASLVHSLVLLRSLWSWRPGQTRGLVGGLIYWAGQLIMIWAAIRAFGPQLGYGPLLLAYTTGFVASILPLPIGGAGGVEAAIIYSLALVGVPLGPALLGTLVQRLFTFWLPLAVALVSARRLRSLGSDLEAVVSQTPPEAGPSMTAITSLTQRTPVIREAGTRPDRPRGLARTAVTELSQVPRGQWDDLIDAGSGALRHGFLRAWEESELRGLRSSPVLAFAEGSELPAAACPGYFYDLDIPTVRAPQLTGVVNQARRLRAGFLYARTYELGSPTPLTNPFLVADPALRPAAVPRLIEAGVEAAGAQRAEFMLVQNFASRSGPAAEELRRRNFAPVPIPPTAVVDTPYGSFEDYLGAMRAQYRRRAQQALKRSASLQIDHLRDFAAEADELARLWYAIYQRAREVRREILPAAFFRSVSALPESSVLVARRPNGSIAAFGLLLDDDRWLSFVQCGFEEEARSEGAYFRLLYEIVRVGIENGFEQVDLGITTLAPKLDVGAVPVPLWAWLKHRNPLLQRIIRTAAQGPLSPPEVAARRVFKDSQPSPRELVQARGLRV